MQITVYQHIFSNVSREQSPTGRRGYQTLFFTQSGLSEQEVKILEDRSQYYASDVEPIKYQFHLLASGKAVITRIIPLQEPDEFGRRGRYLAHSLIVPRGDFAALDYCPLGLLVSAWYFSQLEDAFHQGDRRSGNIPSRVLDVSVAWKDAALRAAKSWAPDQLIRLARLGWQAGQLKESRQAVVAIGELNQFLSALAIVFLLTSPYKRPLLSFDTYVYGCDWSQDWPFWLWGALQTGELHTSYQIETSTHKVEADLNAAIDTPFERWISTRIIPAGFENFSAQQDQTLLLEQILQGKVISPDRWETLEDDIAKDFCALNSQAVIQKVLSQMPKGFSKEMLALLTCEIESDPWGYLKWQRAGLTQHQLTQYFYDLVLSRITQPLPGSDRKVLMNLAREGRHAGLAGLLMLQVDDVSGWQKNAEALSQETYSEQIRVLQSKVIISAREAFCPKYLASWSEQAGQYLRKGDITVVLEQLRKFKGPIDADSLVQLIPYLTKEDKDLLRRWVRSYSGRAPKLRQALAEPDESNASLGERFKSIFSRK